jgi:DNA-binding Lrp family transcriptional regulator
MARFPGTCKWAGLRGFPGQHPPRGGFIRAIIFRERRLWLKRVSAPGQEKGRPMRDRLDAIDRKILRELQKNGRITNVELSKRVGISAPPCLRRVRVLEQAGIIRGYRALLDEKKLGFEVTVFAMVHLVSQAETDLVAFEKRVRALPLVRETWMLSGEVDFILKCVAPDLPTFQKFVSELTATPNVRNVKTALTLRQSKDEAAVPMELVED